MEGRGEEKEKEKEKEKERVFWENKNPTQDVGKNAKSTRARTCQIHTNTTVLQAAKHKSIRNPSVIQYKMLQMFCPRAFFEIIRKLFDFNVCVQITRSHLTSRYIRVGLACVQGTNDYQKIPDHAGHRNPYRAICFLSSLRYSSSNPTGCPSTNCQMY